LFDEKNQRSKISCQGPFKDIFCILEGKPHDVNTKTRIKKPRGKNIIFLFKAIYEKNINISFLSLRTFKQTGDANDQHIKVFSL
jgi:hypothetical protein